MFSNREPLLLVAAKHQVHILNCCPAGTFSKIVDTGHENGLFFIGKHEELGSVGTVAALGIKKSSRYRFRILNGHNFYEPLGLIA